MPSRLRRHAHIDRQAFGCGRPLVESRAIWDQAAAETKKRRSSCDAMICRVSWQERDAHRLEASIDLLLRRDLDK